MKKLSIDSPWALVMVFIVTAMIMAVYEYLKELLFLGSLTLWESHTITIIVTATIASITASIIRSWIISIYLKEAEVELKQHSLVSFKLTLSAVNHIVNNILNYLQIIKVDIDNNGKIPKESLILLEESIEDSRQQMLMLNSISAPENPSSYENIYPK